MRAEEIRIESTEVGFELVIGGDFGDFEQIVVNVHGVAVDLYNEVVKNIGPWISEGLEARREYDSGISGDPLLQGVLDSIRNGESDPDRAEARIESLRVGIDLARKAAKENR